MGFFRRLTGQGSQKPMLPPDIVRMMERFGRCEFDSDASGEDVSVIWRETQAPLQPFATADPEGFVTSLAQAVLPVGGWAVYGAGRTVLNVISPEPEGNPSYQAIKLASIKFLHSRGVPWWKLNGYDKGAWAASGGSFDTWGHRVPVPSLEEAAITDLRPGETRRVAQLTPDGDSSIVFIRQDEQGQYLAILDRKMSETDPQRNQKQWLSAGSLHDLYAEMGLLLHKPYWRDPELEPYIPNWSRYF